MTYYAHTRENSSESQWQTMESHSTQVAQLVSDFSRKFCSENYAYHLGLLHDVGKFQNGFQDRLHGSQIPIEHAICGAQVWIERQLGDAGAYCIAGHHSGLPDGGSITDSPEEPTLLGRLKRTTEDFSAYESNLSIHLQYGNPFSKAVVSNSVEYAFWIRMLYSCLTDGDFLDTEKFVNPQEREITTNFSQCLEKIRHKLDCFPQDTPVRQARSHLRRQIQSKASCGSQIHLMPMPTGSGKTLASMEFALERAVATGKKRIIYVIPYTSIIEQNAKVFRDELGDCVLEHHCNFDFGENAGDGPRSKLRRATENWDVPIVVTTNVQFFQSIYHNKSSHLRKLHNMTDSILVFDEAHMLPIEFFHPCLDAIRILTKCYGCEGIFLSATMPDFSKWFDALQMKLHTQSLITDTTPFHAFQRCNISNLEACSIEKLLGEIQRQENALVVVNSRKTARSLYQLLPGKKFHLSTNMTHYDRDITLTAVREALQSNENFVLISTSLVEAGVDLDFASVFRELAGLDNLLQVAGRCNREGQRSHSTTYSFAFEDAQHCTKSKEILQKQQFTREIFQTYSDVTCPEAIATYFNRLYEYSRDSLEKYDFSSAVHPMIIPPQTKFYSIDFASYSQSFQLIDDNSRSLVIPNLASQPLLDGLSPYTLKATRRKLQKHTISLPQYEFLSLCDHGVVASKEGIDYLANPNYYTQETGISLGEDTLYLF